MEKKKITIPNKNVKKAETPAPVQETKKVAAPAAKTVKKPEAPVAKTETKKVAAPAAKTVAPTPTPQQKPIKLGTKKEEKPAAPASKKILLGGKKKNKKNNDTVEFGRMKRETFFDILNGNLKQEGFEFESKAELTRVFKVIESTVSEVTSKNSIQLFGGMFRLRRIKGRLYSVPTTELISYVPPHYKVLFSKYADDEQSIFKGTYDDETGVFTPVGEDEGFVPDISDVVNEETAVEEKPAKKVKKPVAEEPADEDETEPDENEDTEASDEDETEPDENEDVDPDEED